METLSQQHCFNHTVREAVARCPGCARYFCRECVTEHEDRVICAACLKKQSEKLVAKKGGLRGLLTLLKLSAGVFVLWLIFYVLGQMLLSIPNSFHEGTFWKGMAETADLR